MKCFNLEEGCAATRALPAVLAALTMAAAAGGPGERAQAGPVGGYGGGYGSGGAVPAIAQNYVIRMQEQVKQADEAALRGSQLMADGDYQAALQAYEKLLAQRPDVPELGFNAGNTLHRLRNYERAITETQRALPPNEVQLGAATYYALGNHLLALLELDAGVLLLHRVEAGGVEAALRRVAHELGGRGVDLALLRQHLRRDRIPAHVGRGHHQLHPGAGQLRPSDRCR
jgi:tetratricopeptide (TPR) repeat protein